MVFFGFPTEIQKNTGFLVFHQRPNKKTKKNLVFFGFPPKIKKKPCVFLDFCWKTKKTLGTAEGTTKPKIQNLSEGPETFGFLVFLACFGFPTEIQKNTWCFLVFQHKSKKKHRFFGFSPETEQENQKEPGVFLVFHLKSKKNHVIFWISVGKPKNPRKTRKSKSFAPRRKVLDFWIFGFLVSPVVTCDLLNCFLLVGTGILILKRI